MVVKTFRGLLADAGQERIRLQTIKGKVGYRIVKLQIMPELPGAAYYESVVQVWKKEQAAATSNINLTDSDLLAAAFFSADTAAHSFYGPVLVISDQEIFNQDIYITNQDLQSGNVNYYLELEVIPLDDAGAEYTTLKDMRS
jgi:hypothetical protein